MASLDIHPNAKGHALIAEELDKVIRSRKYSCAEASGEVAQKEEPTAASVKVNKDAVSSDAVSESVSEEITDDKKDEIRLVISALAIVLAVSAAIVLIVTKEKKK